MSGPKVVRIVTREELVAAGQALLSRLDAAVAQWQKDCSANLKAGEVQVTTQRRDALAAMLHTDQFVQFGQAAAREVDFLEADAVRRREQAAQAHAMERSRIFSGREMAKALLQSQQGMAEDLRKELSDAVAGGLSVALMDAALSRARHSMFKEEIQAATVEQRELAGRLAYQTSATRFEEWKSQATRPDERLQAFFSHLLELEALGGTDEAALLSQQLYQLQSVQDSGVRQMRLDTLFIAMRAAKDAAAAKAKLVRTANLLSAELSGFAPEAQAVATLNSAGALKSSEEIKALIADGEKQLTEARTASAAQARRHAVLNGLQKMGYAVHEGLATATASSGRLVVRNPSDNGYGVEVVAGVGFDKMQVRSVAFGASRDASQDIPEDQRWCGDFGKLQAALRADGCEVVIEKALGVGATAMKVVAAGEDERRRDGTATSQTGGAC